MPQSGPCYGLSCSFLLLFTVPPFLFSHCHPLLSASSLSAPQGAGCAGWDLPTLLAAPTDPAPPWMGHFLALTQLGLTKFLLKERKQPEMSKKLPGH